MRSAEMPEMRGERSTKRIVREAPRRPRHPAGHYCTALRYVSKQLIIHVMPVKATKLSRNPSERSIPSTRRTAIEKKRLSSSILQATGLPFSSLACPLVTSALPISRPESMPNGTSLLTSRFAAWDLLRLMTTRPRLIWRPPLALAQLGQRPRRLSKSALIRCL